MKDTAYAKVNLGLHMPQRLLTKSQFLASFRGGPMDDVTDTAEWIVDIWPYVDALNNDELGFENTNDVRHVFRDHTGRIEHVLIGTSRFNSLLVVVIDREQEGILGHYLLDLNEEYGVSGGHLRGIQN